MKLSSVVLLSLVSAQEYDDDFDFEHKKKKEDLSAIGIDFDRNDPEFTNKINIAFDGLFAGAQADPEYLENEDALNKEYAAICDEGADKHGVEVTCAKKTKRPKGTLSYFTQAQKHKQLKLLTLWLADNSNQFGRYSYYGCYCLPQGFENIASRGYGQPVDDIDKSCKSHNQCYDCVRLGNDAVGGSQMTCDPESVLYSFGLTKDGENNKIECLDEVNSCEWRVCSCDKSLAEAHAKNEDKFSHQFDTKWGHETGFVDKKNRWKYNEQCLKKGGNRYGRPTECCGTSFPNMIPRQQGKQCCGFRPFDPESDRKCCPGNKLRPEC